MTTGPNPDCCGLGAGRRCNGDWLRLLREPTNGPLPFADQARGSGPSFSSSPRIRIGTRPGL
jgi:hypothetical protein